MKKSLCAVALACSLVAFSSCASGPRRLSRTWDDWVNEQYTENSWVHGALLQDIIPVYTFVGFFAALGDILFVNPFYFWTEDAWDGKGTGFVHAELPEGVERTVTGSGL